MSHITDVIDVPPIVKNNFSKDGPERRCNMCVHFEYTNKENCLGICNNVDFILLRMSLKAKLQKRIKELEEKSNNQTNPEIELELEGGMGNIFAQILFKVIENNPYFIVITILKMQFKIMTENDPNSNIVMTETAENCEFFEKK